MDGSEIIHGILFFPSHRYIALNIATAIEMIRGTVREKPYFTQYRGNASI